MKTSILASLGTPLVDVDGPAGATVAAKVESFNPAGSAKDRPALSMIEAAEDAGELQPGDAIVEPTSGNTGIGLAMVSAAKGYDLTLVMSASASEERRRLMRAYGADVELVEGDISAARDRADELEAEGALQIGQFEHPANPDAHYRTTAEEIVEQVGDRTVDAFVATIGTGGTISGTGHRLREEFPDLEIVGVEPERSPVLSEGVEAADEHDYQGMGPGFVSENLDTDRLDDVETVPLEDAETECRRLATEEGILVGQSSGAANLAAKRVADRLSSGEDDGDSDHDEPLVVTLFPDSGERYLSTGLFD
jgi:cysteine synthase A